MVPTGNKSTWHEVSSYLLLRLALPRRSYNWHVLICEVPLFVLWPTASSWWAVSPVQLVDEAKPHRSAAKRCVCGLVSWHREACLPVASSWGYCPKFLVALTGLLRWYRVNIDFLFTCLFLDDCSLDQHDHPTVQPGYTSMAVLLYRVYPNHREVHVLILQVPRLGRVSSLQDYVSITARVTVWINDGQSRGKQMVPMSLPAARIGAAGTPVAGAAMAPYIDRLGQIFNMENKFYKRAHSDKS